MAEIPRKVKTGKREAGIASLLVIGSNTVAAYAFDGETAIKILEIISTPALMFAATMFGADWVGKQSPWANPDRPTGKMVPPDYPEGD